jgi:antibiotic biosynthesis monooxygenase (ABM) superfamily enzyme
MTDPAPTERATQPAGPPPKWKFAVIVLLGLYPLLIIIIPLMGRVFDTPYLGVPVTIGPELLTRTLVTVLIVVPLMVWVAIPLVTKLLRPWVQRG